MATLTTWIDQTRAHLLSGHQEQRNTLAANYTAGSGTLSFASAINGIVAGTRLSISLNTFYVLSVNTSGLSATVLGGQGGSSDANAVTGDLVRVNPMVTDFEINTALSAEVSDLSAPDNGLFQISALNLAYVSRTVGYDLTGVTDLIDVYEVRAQDSGTAAWWRQIPKNDWRLDRNADTSLFPSGMSLQVFGDAASGYNLRVLYRTGFTFPATLSTDLTTTGLPTTAYDIAPIGAAMRLMAPREIKRNRSEHQSDTRRAAEIPPGAVANSYRGLMMLRQARVQSEAARLVARYPDRRF